MDIKVDIDPEKVNQMVVQAILQSAIGEEIQKEINNVLKAWDSPVKKAIAKVIDREMVSIISEEFGPTIKEKVKDLVTDDLLTDLVNKAWENFRNR